MVINLNNSFINSFVKGMNSDGAYDNLDRTQYVFGQNIRTTKNQFLGDKNDYASVHEGIVTPVPEGIRNMVSLKSIGEILAVRSVDAMSIIIASTGKNIQVYRFYVSNDINSSVENTFKLLWDSGDIWNTPPKQVSCVLYKELQNVIKLYIADGIHPIICIRVDDEGSERLKSVDLYGNITYAEIDSLINNRIVPTERIYIQDVISGRLTTGQVQYTYRYYNKYGNTTQLAPLTNKILVIDPSRTKETGNAEATETSIGFQIKINIKDYKNIYERLLIYRLLYVKAGDDAEVYLIYDGLIKEATPNNFILNDVGVDPLQQLSMDEFAAMSGIILIPLVIELNQEYMFCGNVIDDTILRIKPNIQDNTILQVTTSVVLSLNLLGDIPNEGNYSYTEQDIITNTNMSVRQYLGLRGINPDIAKSTYNNIFTSSLLRSLRRDETYKYGIVYYDKYGRRTDVIDLGKIDVDDIATNPTFIIQDGILKAKPIGVKILLPLFNYSRDKAAKDIIGCQIIRRASSDIYQKTLLLCALARPVLQGLLDFNVEDGDLITEESVKKSPFYPTGFLTVNDIIIRPSFYTNSENAFVSDNLRELYPLFVKTKNTQLYQIFSSEIDFRRDDILSKLNISDISIDQVLYVPAVFAKYTNSTKDTVFDNGLPQSMSNQMNEVLQNLNAQVISIEPVYPHYTNISRQQIDITKSYVSLVFSNQNITLARFSFFDTNFVENSHIIVNVGENIITNEFMLAFNGPWSRITVSPVRDLVGGDESMVETMTLTIYSGDNYQNLLSLESRSTVIDKNKIEKLTIDAKQARHWIFNFYNPSSVNSGFTSKEINQIKDVKIADWNSGFDLILRDEDLNVVTAIKKYRSFSTNIDKYSYNNWVSFGKYDFRPGHEDQVNLKSPLWYTHEFISKYGHYTEWLNSNFEYLAGLRCGYIGPGPSCLLISTKENTGGFNRPDNRFYTSICNIRHNPKLEDVESDEFVSYYGFGNYFNLKYNKILNRLEMQNGSTDLVVFDGDVYITPHEFTTLYKTYNFESVDTLQSTLVTNYIPLESKVNTYFDYGMNLRNTNSENLLYEPGSIDSITTLERPIHLYNMVYSDNDASNDVFVLISTDENETNNFKQRTYYSELKNNGEFIDNFLIFKTAAFIDVDSKYGQITNLLTDKNQLYYWLEVACGKFSVNERSLINDQNSNTIMLGLAGILSRYDYITTKYGMRKQDFSAISSEAGVFWIDINNKAIVALQQGVVNYGEVLNVQNIINDKISKDTPKINYDLQNNELLCKCFDGGQQLVFNVKFNMATSIYTRDYDYILDIQNHQYGLKVIDNKLYETKYNYLPYKEYEYLSPLKLEFVVNPSASVTKVFDSLQLVPIKRVLFTEESEVDNTSILDNVVMSFETDIVQKTYGNSMEPYTDREGNIIYNIPRFMNEPYGNRIRGKWLRVNILNNNPSEYSTISHIITKFRQSFS